jgi:hypothetical protein
VNTFTCDRCHGTFIKMRSDDDARREYEKLCPEANTRGDETVEVCDDCWREFTVWAKQNGIPL